MPRLVPCLMLRRQDIEFDLPKELIALYPSAKRDMSRLLARSQNGTWTDRNFCQIHELLRPGDLLVLNNTRVIPARLHGSKATGGRVEVLIDRLLDAETALAQVRCSRAPGAGSSLLLGAAKERVSVQAREADLFVLRFPRPVRQLLEDQGEIPLPPYLGRRAEALDEERYQTVFAEREGAVAAPTAGLHFTRALLGELEKQGIASVSLTLHVGLGTFQPIREEDISRHQMHAERVEISAAACHQINACREAGGRIVAVGTTSLRALETAIQHAGDPLSPWSGETRLFIMPGYQFRLVDALITNFHLPGSSLILLVAAFVGLPVILDGYRKAIARRYRFFSYGDAMFLERNDQAGAAV